MIVDDRLMEQLNAANDELKRAWAEYDARIAEAGTSHFSDTAAAIRRELKLDLLLSELNRCLARIGHVDPRTDYDRRLERDEPTTLN
jgi:hypothetical protein